MFTFQYKIILYFYIFVSDDDVQLIIACEIRAVFFMCSPYTEDDALLYRRYRLRGNGLESIFICFGSFFLYSDFSVSMIY